MDTGARGMALTAWVNDADAVEDLLSGLELDAQHKSLIRQAAVVTDECTEGYIPQVVTIGVVHHDECLRVELARLRGKDVPGIWRAIQAVNEDGFNLVRMYNSRHKLVFNAMPKYKQ